MKNIFFLKSLIKSIQGLVIMYIIKTMKILPGLLMIAHSLIYYHVLLIYFN